MSDIYDNDRPATQTEAYNEMVCNLGAANADQCWILTPFDTWERNPSYTGPDQPHPEDDCYLDVPVPVDAHLEEAYEDRVSMGAADGPDLPDEQNEMGYHCY